MISLLRGTVADIGLGEVVIMAGGLGFTVNVTPAFAQELPRGEETTIHTVLVVREDSLTLYGFRSADERRVFDTLLTVSGIGPKIALAALAVLSPDDLRRAVRDQDLAALQKIPGVGKKSAQRMALEIGDKLGTPAALPGIPSQQSPSSAIDQEVKAALVGLGWSEAVAARALEPLSGQGLGAADLLKAALVALGGHRG
ncbi:Holliday junction branch migration protein RuvA [Schaalia sp. ZJ405]|uniref:Holliday junction branch migration protein RuvA n=1 Tax=unclassified Schaalia TaxID=2691889 RepID=UPI0013ECAF72|nr:MULTISPECIES: Holliday junction branch migration protein RuvA [unclassified Schaalia]QPK80522.1 Holliday junction branch migration protein RuvA [Schaalia sp. ZJ405]